MFVVQSSASQIWILNLKAKSAQLQSQFVLPLNFRLIGALIEISKAVQHVENQSKAGSL
jgi:hypothetical protein